MRGAIPAGGGAARSPIQPTSAAGSGVVNSAGRPIAIPRPAIEPTSGGAPLSRGNFVPRQIRADYEQITNLVNTIRPENQPRTIQSQRDLAGGDRSITIERNWSRNINRNPRPRAVRTNPNTTRSEPNSPTTTAPRTTPPRSAGEIIRGVYRDLRTPLRPTTSGTGAVVDTTTFAGPNPQYNPFADSVITQLANPGRPNPFSAAPIRPDAPGSSPLARPNQPARPPATPRPADPPRQSPPNPRANPRPNPRANPRPQPRDPGNPTGDRRTFPQSPDRPQPNPRNQPIEPTPPPLTQSPGGDPGGDWNGPAPEPNPDPFVESLSDPYAGRIPGVTYLVSFFTYAYPEDDRNAVYLFQSFTQGFDGPFSVEFTESAIPTDDNSEYVAATYIEVDAISGQPSTRTRITQLGGTYYAPYDPDRSPRIKNFLNYRIQRADGTTPEEDARQGRELENNPDPNPQPDRDAPRSERPRPQPIPPPNTPQPRRPRPRPQPQPEPTEFPDPPPRPERQPEPPPQPTPDPPPFRDDDPTPGPIPGINPFPGPAPITISGTRPENRPRPNPNPRPNPRPQPQPAPRTNRNPNPDRRNNPRPRRRPDGEPQTPTPRPDPPTPRRRERPPRLRPDPRPPNPDRVQLPEFPDPPPRPEPPNREDPDTVIQPSPVPFPPPNLNTTPDVVPPPQPPQPPTPPPNLPTNVCEQNACTTAIRGDIAGVRDQIGQLAQGGLQLADLALLNVINSKLGPQLPGGIGGFLTKFARSIHLDKIYNGMSLILQIHNAAMLSRNLGESLGFFLESGLSLLGLKDENDTPLDITGTIGGAVSNFIKGIIGADLYNGISVAFQKLSAIYGAAMGVIDTIVNTMAGVAEGLEIVGGYTGKIGNSLKKAGVVLENAYNWMDENLRVKTGRFAAIQKVTDGIESAENVVNNLTEVTEISQETIDQVNTVKDEFLRIRNLADANEALKNVGELANKQASQGGTPSRDDKLPANQ